MKKLTKAVAIEYVEFFAKSIFDLAASARVVKREMEEHPRLKKTSRQVLGSLNRTSQIALEAMHFYGSFALEVPEKVLRNRLL